MGNQEARMGWGLTSCRAVGGGVALGLENAG